MVARTINYTYNKMLLSMAFVAEELSTFSL